VSLHYHRRTSCTHHHINSKILSRICIACDCSPAISRPKNCRRGTSWVSSPSQIPRTLYRPRFLSSFFDISRMTGPNDKAHGNLDNSVLNTLSTCTPWRLSLFCRRMHSCSSLLGTKRCLLTFLDTKSGCSFDTCQCQILLGSPSDQNSLVSFCIWFQGI
jgi:hypothetical protein